MPHRHRRADDPERYVADGQPDPQVCSPTALVKDVIELLRSQGFTVPDLTEAELIREPQRAARMLLKALGVQSY